MASRSPAKPDTDGGDKGGSIQIPRAWLPYILAFTVGSGGATAINRWILPPQQQDANATIQYLEHRFDALDKRFDRIYGEISEIRREHVSLTERAVRIEENLKRNKR